MKLMDKLKEILFDEVTVEIPVITKEEKPIKESLPKKVKEEDVIVKKITPTKTHDIEDEETLFDMPKLKEETKSEVKTNTFTFPVFDDDELDLKETRTEKKVQSEVQTKDRTREQQSREPERKYDYLSSTNYKSQSKRKEQSSSTVNKTASYDDHRPFTLSPIISPVYGILNENYKKEDIVTKGDGNSSRLSSEKLDLDSVRKKAYGTLEDEIELGLTDKNNAQSNDDILDEVPELIDTGIKNLEDDGITIDDLLVDKNEKVQEKIEEVNDEIELDDENELSIEPKNKEVIGEEDLFDLIDSLYAGKEEN